MHQRDMLFCVDTVRRLSRNSRALRAKVGCVIWDMKRRTIVSLGYNGTPEGEDNEMERDNIDFILVCGCSIGSSDVCISNDWKTHHLITRVAV